jgi:hypothetical protein
MIENPNKEWRLAQGQTLDRELDTALAKYATVEVRPGMEDRILANLRAAGEHAPARWRWPWTIRWSVAAVAVAATVLLIVGLAWRSGARPAPAIAQRQGTPLDAQSATPQSKSIRLPAPVTRPVVRRIVATAAPKLEQFPSPQPLSEQEKLLAAYVDDYPDRAVLLARARIEALRRDQIEETQPLPQAEGATDSEDQNSDTSER